MAMNSLPRWLISITDMPAPCQSSNSARTCSNTSSGSVAGPGLKLKTLFTLDIYSLFLKLMIGKRRARPVAFDFVRVRNDAVEPDQPVAVDRARHAHALGVAPELLDLGGGHADQTAAVGDQHHVVAVVHFHRADQPSGLVREGLGDDALPAASAQRELRDRRALAVALFGNRQNVALARDDQRN